MRPYFPQQPRVCSRNQRLLPSYAPRNVNISPILSTLRILPVATGCTLIPSALRRSPGPPPSPLESTLAKVYQNKQLQLPLESSTYAKPGGGRGHCYLAAPVSSLCSGLTPPSPPPHPYTSRAPKPL